uniref:C-type lectin domain-containing protein n=1 Tax=Strigops habroptila TaxID=2489341 RepID=A0A672UCC6_STRHB
VSCTCNVESSLTEFPRRAVKPEACHHRKCPPEQCLSGWIGFRNKCYFISEEEKNWTSSQTFCTSHLEIYASHFGKPVRK